VWFTSPRHAELQTASIRDCGDDDVTVQALYSGISHGTEMKIYQGLAPADQHMEPEENMEGSLSFPIKYGYASVGRIVEAGRTSGFRVGEPVFVAFPHQDVYTLR